MADDAISLRVRIEDRGGGEYDVALVDDTATTLAIRRLGPLADDSAINQFLGSLATARSRDLRPANEPAHDWQQLATTLGTQIFNALFADTTLVALTEQRVLSDTTKRQLRLRIETVGATDRGIVPWEALYFDDKFLLLEPRLSVVRTPPGPVSTPPPIEGPLRVLVVAASPADQQKLSADEEYAAIERALDLLVQDGRVELTRLTPPTWPSLQNAFAHQAERPWHVLHFIGHGDVRESTGVLVFCNADDLDQSDMIEAQAVGQLLQGSEHLRLIVLNGCRTASDPDRVPLRGVAAQLAHHQSAPAIVAMQAPITDAGATLFATEFYTELAKASTLDAAVRAGRDMLIGTPEWLTPVVFMRGSGQLFELPPPAFRPVEELPATLPTPVIARPWLIDLVAEWAHQASAAGAQNLLITGDPGAGTSVIALLLAAGISDGTEAGRAKAQEIKDGWSAALSCSPRAVGGASDPYTFVTRIREQLIRSTPEFAHAARVVTDRVTATASTDDDFERRLAEPLRRTDLGDRQIRILIEGLEDADRPANGPSVPALVERLAKLRNGVRLVVCCSNDDTVIAPLLDTLPPPLRLDLSAPEQATAVNDDIRRFVVEVCGDAVTTAQVENVVDKAAGSFLYATYVARQLAASGDAEQSLPADLAAAYRDLIDRSLGRVSGLAERDALWSTELEPLLGCLAVSRGPVPIVALARWLQWDTARLAAALGRYSPFVRHERGHCAIRHPALRELLLGDDATFADRTVDPLAARRRIVETTLALGVDFDLTAVRGDDYSLSNLPFHVNELIEDDPREGARLDDASVMVLTEHCVEALDRATDDPVVIARPFRDLGAALARHRSPEHVARVLRFAAGSGHVAVRSVVLDVLLSLVEQSSTPEAATAAEKLVVDLATGEDAALAALAIHATCGMRDSSAQARVFSRVVEVLDRAGDEPWVNERRIVAAYGLYISGRTGENTLDVVLRAFIGEVQRHRVLRLRGQLQFVTEVTVTNYINHCDEPGVVEMTNDRLRQLLVDELHVDGPVGRAVEKVIAPLTAHLLSTRVLSLLNSDRFLGDAIPNADVARRVLDTLDPSVPLGPRRDDLATLLNGEVDALRVLAAHAIAVHQIAEPDAAGPVVEDLWTTGDRVARRWLLFSHAVLLRDTPGDWAERLRPKTELLWSSADASDVDELLQGVPLLGVPLGLAEAKAVGKDGGLGSAMGSYEDVMRESANPYAELHAITGLGITGLHHPGVVFTVLERMRSADVSPTNLATVLGIMAGLHPLDVRAWAEQRGMWDDVASKIDLVTTRKALNIVGHFNHAVHACVHYPQMRVEICRPVYEYFLDAKSPRAWSDRYAKQGQRMLRQAEFEPIRWTR